MNFQDYPKAKTLATLSFIALSEGLRERFLKTRARNLYYNKNHIKFYNFCQ